MGHKHHTKILLAFSVVFFVIYLFLSWEAPVMSPKWWENKPPYLIFNQPDEAVNYFFVRDLLIEHRFGAPEPLAALSDNQVHPRSTTVVHGKLVPIGFPAFIVIVSAFALSWTAVFGTWSLNIFAVGFTPFVAALTPLLLYGWLRRVFDRTIAFWSAPLLFVLPPWWYYASRAMQHNTLFVFLLVAGLYAFFKAKEKATGWWLLLSGLCGGLMLAVRPAEAVWIAVLLGIGAYVSKSAWRAKQWGMAVSGVLFGLLFLFVVQTAYYGSPLASGYVKPQASGAAGSVLSGPQGIPLLQALVAPFGIHPTAMAWTLYHYGMKLFLPWFLTVAIGAVLAWRQPVYRKYLLLLGGFSGYLLLYYGSWRFADNLQQNVSIGSSQVRYFLPVYVFSLPFAAFLLREFYSKFRAVQIIGGMVFAALILFSFRAVYLRFEGLLAVRDAVSGYYDWRGDIGAATEPNSVVVTRYADKYLFPARKVIPGVYDETQWQAIAALRKDGYPVYWYDLPLSPVEKQRYDTALERYGLRFGDMIQLRHGLELRAVE